MNDSGNHRVQKFTSEGKFIADNAATIGCMHAWGARMDNSLGHASVSARRNRLYICD